MTAPTRLEVWGDPIAHSLSPTLHAAAYRVLGLDWTYGRRQVTADAFDDEIDASKGRGVRRLSLTFPLKAAAYDVAARVDRHAQLTGAANTLLLFPEGALGANTDVGGLRDALVEVGVDAVESVRIVGAGATARSAMVAAEMLGAERIDVVARRVEAVDALAPLAAELGIRLTGSALDAPHACVDLTIGALPGGTDVPDAVADRIAEDGGRLYDVVYGHWPTSLCAAFQRTGLATHDGRGMLLHQAVRQVRLFVHADSERPLEDEPAVVAAMREALMGD